MVAQQKAFRAWAHFARASLRALTGVWRRSAPHGGAGTEMSAREGRDRFDARATAGDVLLAPGAPWAHPDYASLIDRHRSRRGLRFALLVYDLAPLRHPEWFDRGLVRLFRAWFKDLLPVCDHVFAISQATAADVEAYAREQAVTLPTAVVPIPIGTDLSLASGDAGTRRGERLPSIGSYALIVATIEIRKNHLLLFRVWRRLLKELPRERVPTLVFAGRVGWLVDDLMQQIANTDYLDGKLQIIENPSDEELAALYSGCLFTLFPSLYEGWGLPVTESLSFGKPCFISNRTSLPEAGGGLARSFDPDDLRDAYDKIRTVLEDRAELQRWGEEVSREFRPVPWSAAVEALLTGLGVPLAAPQPSDAQRAA